MVKSIFICALFIFTCSNAFNIQRQSVGTSSPNTQQIQSQSSNNGSSASASQLNGTRGFVLDHQIDSLSVEKQKAEEKIEYHEFADTKATAKNKITNAKSNKKMVNNQKKTSHNVHKVNPKQHNNKVKSSTKYQNMPDESYDPVDTEQYTTATEPMSMPPGSDMEPDMANDYENENQPTDQENNYPTEPQEGEQPEDADMGQYEGQGQEAEEPEAAPGNEQGQEQQEPQQQPPNQQQQQPPNQQQQQPPNQQQQQSPNQQQPTQFPNQQPQTTMAAGLPGQNYMSTTPTNLVSTTPAVSQQPPNPISQCPSEVESVGCFNFAGPNSGLFDTLITSKTPTQSLEEFFCACGYMVQSKGWVSYILTGDSCYSSQKEPNYQSSGESSTCVNESGSQCTDADTYCQGAADSMSVYKIISAKHRSKLSKKNPKKN